MKTTDWLLPWKAKVRIAGLEHRLSVERDQHQREAQLQKRGTMSLLRWVTVTHGLDRAQNLVKGQRIVDLLKK